MLHLGESLVKSVDNLLKNIQGKKNSDFDSFFDKCKSFIDIVEKSNSHNHWGKILTVQQNELASFLVQQDSESELKDRTTENTKYKDQSLNHENNFQYFEPLIDKSLRIPCSNSKCTTSFLYKRSYTAHMKQFHRTMRIEKVKDPVGVCRLIRYF